MSEKPAWSRLEWSKLETLVEPQARVKSPFQPLKSARDLALGAGEEPSGEFKALWGQRAPEPPAPPPVPERSVDFERELEAARQAGWDEGYAKASQEALEREQAQDRLAQALHQGLETLAATRTQLVSQDLASSVADLGFELAKTAFGPPKKPSEQHWKMLVDALFDQLMSVAGPAQIFASPIDLPSLQTALETLSARWPDELKALADDQLQPGFLRMARGPFGADASFQSRLASISHAMKDADELS